MYKDYYNLVAVIWNIPGSDQIINRSIRRLSHIDHYISPVSSVSPMNETNNLDTDTYIGKELSGEQFNKLFINIEFVKLTSCTENHNNFQFTDGLNVDIRQFNPVGECSAGGIYFTDLRKSHLWIKYGSSVMEYIRNVIIPDDARVYIEKNKFKADKIFLGPKTTLKHFIMAKVLMANGLELQNVEEQTEELCKQSVQQNI